MFASRWGRPSSLVRAGNPLGAPPRDSGIGWGPLEMFFSPPPPIPVIHEPELCKPRMFVRDFRMGVSRRAGGPMSGQADRLALSGKLGPLRQSVVWPDVKVLPCGGPRSSSEMLLKPVSGTDVPNWEGGKTPGSEIAGHAPRPPTRRALASRDGRAGVLGGLWPAMERPAFFPTALCLLLLPSGCRFRILADATTTGGSGPMSFRPRCLRAGVVVASV